MIKAQNKLKGVAPFMTASSMELVLYQEHYQSADDIIQLMPDDIEDYLIILHNRDVKDKDTGELKKAHYHVYLKFTNNKTFKKVAEMFNTTENSVCRIKGSLKDCYEYALHKNADDKVQYDESEIVSSNIDRFKRSTQKESKPTSYYLDYLQDVMNGATPFELVAKYGRDGFALWKYARELAERQRYIDREREQDD